MKLTSPAFKPRDLIPRKYTCDGENVSPPLEIDELPEGTGSLALVVDDIDSAPGTFVHCVAFDIPPEPRIEEGGIGGRLGLNDFGEIGYGGPCPGSGTHRYVFRAYALDQKTMLSEGVTRIQLERAMQGHVLAQAELVGLYRKEKARGAA